MGWVLQGRIKPCTTPSGQKAPEVRKTGSSRPGRRSILSDRLKDKRREARGALRWCWSSHYYQKINRGRYFKHIITLLHMRRESCCGKWWNITKNILDWSLGAWQSVNHFYITRTKVFQFSLVCLEYPSLSLPVTTPQIREWTLTHHHRLTPRLPHHSTFSSCPNTVSFWSKIVSRNACCIVPMPC